LGVALTGLPARARRVAPVDRVLDARALEGAVDRDRAGPEREQLARELERLAHRRRGIEGAIINRAVVLDPPRDQESWEIFIRRQFEKRIVFIVPQYDVVPGQVGELLLEAHRRSRRRSALIRSRRSAACSKSSRRAASFIRASSSPIRFASSAGDANASSAGASTSTV